MLDLFASPFDAIGTGFGRRRRDPANPYAGALAVWRADDPDLVLVSGRVSEWPDYLDGPATLIQPTAGDRLFFGADRFPGDLPGVGATSTTDFAYALAATAPELVGLLDNPAASWDVEMVVVHRAANGFDQAIISWGGIDTVHFGWLGVNSQGDLRYLRRVGAPAQKVVDSAPVFVVGQPIRLLVALRAGLLYAWADGVQILFGDDVATGHVSASFQRVTVGCRWTTAQANGFQGDIREIVVRAY